MYRCIYTFTLATITSNVADIQLISNISNYNIKKIDGYVTSTGAISSNVNTWFSSELERIIVYEFQNNSIRATYGKNLSQGSLELILEYTKTTD